MLGAWSRRARQPVWWLAAVAVLHGLSSLVLVGVHHPFGADETVYLSQISATHPATVFSAPRARGMTLVVAPVTAWTGSVAAVRLWLAAVSAAGTFLAFRPWLRLVRPVAVPVAALLFSSLWTTVYYGEEAMPDLYVALLAVAAVAAVLLHRRDPRPRLLLTAAGCLAAAALVRPSDALWLLAPLLVAATRPGPARRPRAMLALALTGGFAAGSAEWVVEAFVRFGGPLQRLHLAAAEQGGGGLHFSLPAQARALAGPLLCRGGCVGHAPVWAMAWWLGLAVLVVVGVVATRNRGPLLLATAAGLGVAAEYATTIGYAAPRFLSPAYALLALPAAAGLVGSVEAARRWSWPVAPAAVAAAAVVVAQLVTQLHVLRADIVPTADRRLGQQRAVAAALRTDLRLGRGCAIAGPAASPIAYDSGCRSLPADPGRMDSFEDRLGTGVVWLAHHRRLPPQLAGWSELSVRAPGLHRAWFAAVAPTRA